jgi:hypothetical protein
MDFWGNDLREISDIQVLSAPTHGSGNITTARLLIAPADDPGSHTLTTEKFRRRLNANNVATSMTSV